MNAQIVPYQPPVRQYGGQSLTAADIRAQVNLIQDVMKEVMQEGVHYGKIPGTNGKSLWKPGAEKLAATFRLAAQPRVEDLSADGEIHYRVFVALQASDGTFVGEGVGECSSREEKYSWRKIVHLKEYEATPENRRRIKFDRDGGETKQVRTSPYDVANTILKMAKKRAQVDAVITATAAGDIFTQDIEDLPEEIVAEMVGEGRASRGSSAAQAAVQQAAPVDSMERDAAIAEAQDVASLGYDALSAWWKADANKPKRVLIPDKLDALKAIAKKADEEAAE